MRKTLFSISLVLVSLSCYGQTAVTGTVTDSDGFAWAGGSYSINFYPTPAVPQGSGKTSWGGKLDSTGSLSVTLPYESQSGASWTFQVCANATLPSCVSTVIAIPNSTPTSVSTQLSAIARGPRFSIATSGFGYGTTEVSPNPPPGSIFYNVSPSASPTCNQWTGSAWASCNGNSGTVNAGTTGQIGYYAGNGAAVSGSAATVDSSGNITVPSLDNAVLVDGTTYPRTNAGIQAAINAAPADGTVIIPPGTYALTGATGQQILVDGTHATHLVCLGWGANLQLQTGAGAIPVIRWTPPTGSTVLGWSVHGCQISTQTGGLGSYAIEIDLSANSDLINPVISDNYIGCPVAGQFQCTLGSGFGSGAFEVTQTGAGGLLNLNFFRNRTYGSYLLSNVGDAMNFERNDIWPGTNSDTFSIASYAGSTSFRLLHNTIRIPVHLGFDVQGALIEGNEWEPASSSLAGSNGAMLDLDGTATNAVSGTTIANNSFQMSVNASTLNAIRLNYATQTDIGGPSGKNKFYVGSTPAYDIVTTANAYANRVRHNDYEGTTSWATILNDVAGNTQITDDANVGGSLGSVPLVTQGSGGGTNIYGANGVVFEAYGGVNYVTDGQPAADIAAAFSPLASSVPVTGTTASFYNVFIQGAIQSGGTHPTVTGCGTISSQTGGALSGTFVTSATSCTPVLTSLPSTANGYECVLWDQTHPTTPLGNVSSTTTSATFGTLTTTASDKIAFNCGLSN